MSTSRTATAAPVVRDPHRVAVLVRHGVMPMELGLVHQLLGQPASNGVPLYEVITCTLDPGRVRTNADFPIHVEHGPEILAEADTVLLPAAHETDESETTGKLSSALSSAFALIKPGTRIASICTGSFLLAATGLLDGRRATTHWNASDQFRTLYPKVRLDPDVLYVDEGDVLTSAGEASGIDLCLHLIRKDHGNTIANSVARATVVAPHRDGGQAQFIERPVPERDTSSTAPARAWALAHLHQPITVRDMAEAASMSVRTFTRRFRAETGISALRWLTQRRIEHARKLLEQTDRTVDRVAEDAGFGTGTSLRGHFLTTLGVSPNAYRRTFRGARVPSNDSQFAPVQGPPDIAH